MDHQTYHTIKELLAFRNTRPSAVQRLRDTSGQLLARVRQVKRPDLDSLVSAAEDVVSLVGRFRRLRPDDEGPSILMLNAFCPEDEPKAFSLEDHLLNVAVLATHLCWERFGEGERLVGLALAGLVHDVGMCLLPSDIFSKNGPLEPEELRALRRHPLRSAALVATWGEPLAPLADILAQEHERLDGSGYPHGLMGEEVFLESRILGLVDTYESMTHYRPYRSAKCPRDVMRTLLAVATRLFGRELSQLFVRRFSMYPVGSVVELSSMEQGVVVELNHDEPMRPYVFVVGGRDRWRPPRPRVVNLKENRLLHILRSIPSPGPNEPVVEQPTSSI